MPERPTDTRVVYTLADLDKWPDAPARENVSLAALGHPVAHSVSPAMHNTALARLSQAHPTLEHWRYYKFDVTAQQLKEALPLFAQKGFRGLNLTVPLKVDVLALLDKSARPPVGVKIAGAANTLYWVGGGWKPFNTDIAGLRYGIAAQWGNEALLRPLVVMGTGGAARAALALAKLENAESVQVRSRSLERAQAFCKEMGDALDPVRLIPTPAEAPLPEDALVVNATPLGLKPDDASPVAAQLLGPNMRVFDMTYGRHCSRLRADAAACGAKASDGLPMLAAQGFYALTLWLQSAEFPPPDEHSFIELMLQAAREATGIAPRP